MKILDLVIQKVTYQLSLGEYSIIRQAYVADLEGIISEYLTTPGVRITRFRNAFKKAVVTAFVPAFEMGITDGGGEAPAVGDDLDWINARVEAEFGYADLLFQQLKELKSTGEDTTGVASQKAEGYARTLDGIYDHGKLRGAKDLMLTFLGLDGKENCRTCRKLKGQRHKASWWLKRDLMPYRGNPNLECGGWECQHALFDDNGHLFVA